MQFCIYGHKSTAAQATKSDPEMQFCILGHKSTAAQAIKYDPYKQFIFCLLGHNYIQNLLAFQSPSIPIFRKNKLDIQLRYRIHIWGLSVLCKCRYHKNILTFTSLQFF